MRISRSQESEISAAIELSTKLIPVLLGIAFVGLVAFFGWPMLIAALSLFAVALVSFGGLVLSWRYYRQGVSIYAWLLCSAALATAITVAVVLPSVRAGALHPLAALAAMAGWLPLGVVGPLVMFRSRLRAWLSA